MILKHHLENDKKDQPGWKSPKLNSFPPFLKSQCQPNLLSYKYLNTILNCSRLTPVHEPSLPGPVSVKHNDMPAIASYRVSTHQYSPHFSIRLLSAGFCRHFSSVLVVASSHQLLRCFIILQQNRSFQ